MTDSDETSVPSYDDMREKAAKLIEGGRNKILTGKKSWATWWLEKSGYYTKMTADMLKEPARPETWFANHVAFAITTYGELLERCSSLEGDKPIGASDPGVEGASFASVVAVIEIPVDQNAETVGPLVLGAIDIAELGRLSFDALQASSGGSSIPASAITKAVLGNDVTITIKIPSRLADGTYAGFARVTNNGEAVPRTRLIVLKTTAAASPSTPAAPT